MKKHYYSRLIPVFFIAFVLVFWFCGSAAAESRALSAAGVGLSWRPYFPASRAVDSDFRQVYSYTPTPLPTMPPVATITPFPTATPFSQVTPFPTPTPITGFMPITEALGGYVPGGVFCAPGNNASICTVDGEYLFYTPTLHYPSLVPCNYQGIERYCADYQTCMFPWCLCDKNKYQCHSLDIFGECSNGEMFEGSGLCKETPIEAAPGMTGTFYVFLGDSNGQCWEYVNSSGVPYSSAQVIATLYAGNWYSNSYLLQNDGTASLNYDEYFLVCPSDLTTTTIEYSIVSHAQGGYRLTVDDVFRLDDTSAITQIDESYGGGSAVCLSKTWELSGTYEYNFDDGGLRSGYFLKNKVSVDHRFCDDPSLLSGNTSFVLYSQGISETPTVSPVVIYDSFYITSSCPISSYPGMLIPGYDWPVAPSDGDDYLDVWCNGSMGCIFLWPVNPFWLSFYGNGYPWELEVNWACYDEEFNPVAGGGGGDEIPEELDVIDISDGPKTCITLPIGFLTWVLSQIEAIIETFVTLPFDADFAGVQDFRVCFFARIMTFSGVMEFLNVPTYAVVWAAAGYILFRLFRKG